MSKSNQLSVAARTFSKGVDMLTARRYLSNKDFIEVLAKVGNDLGMPKTVRRLRRDLDKQVRHDEDKVQTRRLARLLIEDSPKTEREVRAALGRCGYGHLLAGDKPTILMLNGETRIVEGKDEQNRLIVKSGGRGRPRRIPPECYRPSPTGYEETKPSPY